MSKSALITGITGQDGSYLAELLLSKGYEVYGFVRRTSTDNRSRIMHLLDDVTLLDGDMVDVPSIMRAIDASHPDEVYHLAAQSYVGTSWDQPVSTADFDALGTTRLLEAVRLRKLDARIYQASSSEMFGKVVETPQRETTPFHPRSPYGVSKVYSYWATVNHRESFGMYACNGILFNHESPRRGLEFVTRRITMAVARIKHGLQDKLTLGDVEAKRDWGFAGEYVEAMWRMLQQPEPDDYVIATGETHSVSEFAQRAFARVGLDWRDHVVIDESILRPAEVQLLLGDPTKARDALGWEAKVRFAELADLMVDADMELVEREARR